MFACIHTRSISKTVKSDPDLAGRLIELAFTFSPLIEQTSVDTVVLDVAGQDLLFGETPAATVDETNVARNIANAIVRRAKDSHLPVNVAVAVNADAAIHAARSFEGITIIDAGYEPLQLGSLSIKQIDYSLAGVDEKCTQEIQQTFALWGIETFGDLAKLPSSGVAERLGQEGVRLQKLSQGKSDRRLNLVRPPIGFAQSLELEHPVTELEPLSFILSRLMNQLCANLNEHALATNELRLRLVTERSLEYRLQPGISGANEKDPTEVGTLNSALIERTINLPVPMRDPKTLLRLFLFEIEREPPSAPVIAVTIVAEPVKPRVSQTGLFIPLAPEPEKLEITLARLAKLVGPENVGSPEILETHRPDAFRMRRFRSEVRGQRPGVRRKANRQSAIDNPQCVMGFRMFRPPWHAEVQTLGGQPTRLNARSDSSRKVRGKIVSASGPWRMSGDWWRGDVWARDEWDVAVIDQASSENEILCRIYRDLTNEQWFVAGIYD